LAAPELGKKGAMAAFETAGNIVLSHQPTTTQPDEPNEKKTFDCATLEIVRRMLSAISPSRQSARELRMRINSMNMRP